MQLKWTSKALADLARLYEFLAPVNRSAAARTVQSLTVAPTNLLDNPRIGERLEEFDPPNEEIQRQQTDQEPVEDGVYRPCDSFFVATAAGKRQD